MTATRRKISNEVTAWAPWSTELRALIKEVREVASSEATDGERRERLGQLGTQARCLLDRIGSQPTLPGGFGEAVEILRAPTSSEPIRISEALERLGDLSLLLEPVSAVGRHHRTKSMIDHNQAVLPGFDSANNPGDKQ